MIEEKTIYSIVRVADSLFLVDIFRKQLCIRKKKSFVDLQTVQSS